MSPGLLVAAASAVCALIPAVLYTLNRLVYRPPARIRAVGTGTATGTDPGTPAAIAELPAVSVLIPARDEEASIGGALDAVLGSQGVELEVVVLDDGSRDRTAEIVLARAAVDPRVRLERSVPLPAGWCGKQHACAQLARHARHDVLVFVDADVRLAPEGLARAVGFLGASGAALVSGFPRQVTGTWLEKLEIPLIHFILLGFLPLWWMRRSVAPAYGAGCGQLFVARREAYEAVGGHGAIRGSLHDGVKLPRAFRRAGFRTDLFDASEVAVCRMYDGAGAVWRGLAKNATEGLAAPAAIVPWTVLLGLGQVVPVGLLVTAVGVAWAGGEVAREVVGLAVVAVVASYGPRLDSAWRFGQSWWGAVGHPVGVGLLLGIQWWALGRRVLGRPASWKGRSYGGG